MLECPFCGYHSTCAYAISLHVETLHSDNHDSPFATKDDASLSLALSLQREEEASFDTARTKLSRLSPSSIAPASSRQHGVDQDAPADGDDADVDYVQCPQQGCGEHVFLIDYNDHLDIHVSLDELSPSHTIATMHESDSGYETEQRRKKETTLTRTATIIESKEPPNDAKSTSSISETVGGLRLGVSNCAGVFLFTCFNQSSRFSLLISTNSNARGRNLVHLPMRSRCPAGSTTN